MPKGNNLNLIFSTPLPLDNKTRFDKSSTLRLPRIKTEYTLYPLAQLAELIQNEKKDKDTTKLRFLLRNNGQLYFGPEGAGPKIAVHYQLTGDPASTSSCKAAGNIGFDRNSHINFISNKSGDFKPEAPTLRYLIKILSNNPALLAEEITLELFCAQGKFLNKEKVSKKDLFERDMENVPQVPQSQEKIIVSYDARVNKRKFSALDGEEPAPHKKRIKFANSLFFSTSVSGGHPPYSVEKGLTF